MTLRIFKEHKVRYIDNAIKVLTHSAGTSNEGIDLEVYMQEYKGYLILTEKIHLDKWDFYCVEG